MICRRLLEKGLVERRPVSADDPPTRDKHADVYAPRVSEDEFVQRAQLQQAQQKPRPHQLPAFPVTCRMAAIRRPSNGCWSICAGCGMSMGGRLTRSSWHHSPPCLSGPKLPNKPRRFIRRRRYGRCTVLPSPSDRLRMWKDCHPVMSRSAAVRCRRHPLRSTSIVARFAGCAADQRRHHPPIAAMISASAHWRVAA